MGNKKSKGKYGEQIALAYLQTLGLKPVAQNYTIPGGEVDIIVESDLLRVFVEVKYVAPDTELVAYITSHKIAALKRTVEQFQLIYPTTKDYRIDVIFVTGNRVREHYENITLYL